MEKAEEEKFAKEIGRKNAKQSAKTKAEVERKGEKFVNQSTILSVREEADIKKQALLQKKREIDANKNRRKRVRGPREEDQAGEDFP
jgi:hypothetical protein